MAIAGQPATGIKTSWLTASSTWLAGATNRAGELGGTGHKEAETAAVNSARSIPTLLVGERQLCPAPNHGFNCCMDKRPRALTALDAQFRPPAVPSSVPLRCKAC
jgi:hypothetical protein